jgi:hypothetical protein
MVARLGQVLYWAACAIAVFWLILGLFGVFTRETLEPWNDIPVFIGGAILIWLIGRAVRYVLAGK